MAVVKINAIEVPDGAGAELERRFANRLHAVDGQPGFLSFELLRPGAPFVQFTYAVVPPIPARSRKYTARGSNRIWLNLPPARVWVYRRSA